MVSNMTLTTPTLTEVRAQILDGLPETTRQEIMAGAARDRALAESMPLAVLFPDLHERMQDAIALVGSRPMSLTLTQAMDMVSGIIGVHASVYDCLALARRKENDMSAVAYLSREMAEWAECMDGGNYMSTADECAGLLDALETGNDPVLLVGFAKELYKQALARAGLVEVTS